jgi:hypothetical protein
MFAVPAAWPKRKIGKKFDKIELIIAHVAA